MEPDDLPGGTIIRMAFGEGGRLWWIERPERDLSPERVAALGNQLVEMGDSLFGWPGFSQTWRIVEDD